MGYQTAHVQLVMGVCQPWEDFMATREDFRYAQTQTGKIELQFGQLGQNGKQLAAWETSFSARRFD